MLSRLDPTARKFLLRVPIAGLVALGLWYAGGNEAYGRVLTATTETTIRLLERPSVTLITWDDGVVLLRRADFSTRSNLPAFSPTSFAWNFVILFALYLASPDAGTRPGCLSGLAAALALFATHVLHFALAVGDLYARLLGPWSVANYPRWERELLAAGRYFFDIALVYALPFVIWGLIVLLPTLRRHEASGAPLSPAPPRWRRKKKKKKR